MCPVMLNGIFFPAAGRRSEYTNFMDNPGTAANYWISTVDGTNALFLNIFGTTSYNFGSGGRAAGKSVRCIKN